MKKFLYSLLPYVLEVFCCFIYSFIMSGIVLCLFSLDFCYFEKLFIVFFLGTYFLPSPSFLVKFLWQ